MTSMKNDPLSWRALPLVAVALLLGGCPVTVSLGQAEPDPFGDGGTTQWQDAGAPFNDARPRYDRPSDVAPVDRPPAEVTMPDEYPPGARCPNGMALVTGGTFDMGLRQFGDPSLNFSGAQPLHRVQVSDFCMDLTEVTVAAYRRCVMGSGCTAPETINYCNWGVAGRDDHPINCVTWDQSLAYCQRRGAALPTEAQWEYAARGTDGRIYPWGDDGPDTQLCWNFTAVWNGTCPVGSFPEGRSPFGVLDMAGNVGEHVADWFGYYGDLPSGLLIDPTGPAGGSTRVIRDNSWDGSNPRWYRAAMRGDINPRLPYRVGFRCARPTR